MDYRNQAQAIRNDLPSQPGRLSEVQEQVIRGQKLTQLLFDRAKSLNERLQPVLRSNAPDGESEKSPKPMLVGHASALSNHNDQLEMIDQLLTNIIDRLEL